MVLSAFLLAGSVKSETLTCSVHFTITSRKRLKGLVVPLSIKIIHATLLWNSSLLPYFHFLRFSCCVWACYGHGLFRKVKSVPSVCLNNGICIPAYVKKKNK